MTQIKQGPRTPSDDHPLKLKVTFCVRGVISPLLSNIYLHVLDRVWEDRCAHLGTLVRYADDFVVMCDTKATVEEAHRRVSTVLTRLGLELHPEKT
ncbi:MAG TPA: reverse transcriptase domain-containing protein, partial [Solirubrobacteraceae bacterium]